MNFKSNQKRLAKNLVLNNDLSKIIINAEGSTEKLHKKFSRKTEGKRDGVILVIFIR
jgi:hypothetical protein